jgi:hypothetical protein
MTRKKPGKVGSSFDGFLAGQGILEECEEPAIKQIFADQIKAAMEKERLTKAAMADETNHEHRPAANGVIIAEGPVTWVREKLVAGTRIRGRGGRGLRWRSG